MDFLDYMKENFGKPYPPAIKFEDGKIYEDSYFTGFSISQKENYSTSAMYEVKEKILGSETPTNYQLEHDKSLNRYKILKFHSDTGYEIRNDGMDAHSSRYSLFFRGSRYTKDSFSPLYEKEEDEEVEESSSSNNSYSSGDDSFWSWGTWGKGWAYCLGATFSVIGILASLVSPFILLIAPGFMVLWGLMILIHNHSKK